MVTLFPGSLGGGKREPGNDRMCMCQNLHNYTIRGLLDCMLLAKFKRHPNTRRISCHRLVVVSIGGLNEIIIQMLTFVPLKDPAFYRESWLTMFYW